MTRHSRMTHPRFLRPACFGVAIGVCLLAGCNSQTDVDAQITDLEHTVGEHGKELLKLHEELDRSRRQELPTPKASEAFWLDRTRWRELELGMTPGAVSELLGEASRVSTEIGRENKVLTRWQYNPETETRAQVTFGNGKLEAWTEP